MITRVVQGTVVVRRPGATRRGRRVILRGPPGAVRRHPGALAHELRGGARRVVAGSRPHRARLSWRCRRQRAPPAEAEDRADGATPAGTEVPALLRLADALRARGRLRDAQGICDGAGAPVPGAAGDRAHRRRAAAAAAGPALERHAGGLPDQRGRVALRRSPRQHLVGRHPLRGGTAASSGGDRRHRHGPALPERAGRLPERGAVLQPAGRRTGDTSCACTLPRSGRERSSATCASST